MKAFKLLALIFTIFFSSCGVLDSDTYTDESNNSKESATLIPLGGTASGRLQVAWDADYFKAVLPNDGQYTISIKNLPSSISKNTVLSSDAFSYEEVPSVVTLNESDSYYTYRFHAVASVVYLKIVGSMTDSAPNVEYSVTFEKDSSDLFEYNDYIVNSKTIETNTLYNATFVNSIDRDCYSSVLSAGLHHFIINGLPLTDKASLYIYDGGQNLIYSSYGSLGTADTHSCNIKSGLYYFRLISDIKSDNPSYNFKLLKDTVDTNEYNNTSSTATSIINGATKQFSIFPKDDIDWFSYSTLTKDTCIIKVDSVPLDIGIYINADRIKTYEYGHNVIDTVIFSPGINTFYIQNRSSTASKKAMYVSCSKL